MSNSSMVIGYFVGFVDLVNLFPWLGDSQIKVFCVIAIFVFCLTLSITCITTQEKKLDLDDQDNQFVCHVAQKIEAKALIDF